MSKYQYEQSWAKLKKELPTINFKTYVNTSSALTIQTWIANELAEANRLKRIELRIQITQVGQTDFKEDTISNWLEELEDKA